MTRSIDYRYDACGLDNVVLKDLPVVTDDDGEDVITIPNINLLHRVLMAQVASKESGLQPKELKFLRTQLGLTQAELADLVGRDTQTIGRWERGENPIDKSAEIVIRKYALERTASDGALPTEELARRTMSMAGQPPFLIDASNPDEYRPLPIAA